MATLPRKSKDVGKMDRRIKIRRSVEVSDGAGGRTTSWTDYKSTWSEVTDTSWMLAKQGGGEVSGSMKSFKIWYDAQINTKDFCIEYNGYRYIPYAVKDPGESRIFLILDCNGNRLDQVT